jgi:hypothetical protein
MEAQNLEADQDTVAGLQEHRGGEAKVNSID